MKLIVTLLIFGCSLVCPGFVKAQVEAVLANSPAQITTMAVTGDGSLYLQNPYSDFEASNGYSMENKMEDMALLGSFNVPAASAGETVLPMNIKKIVSSLLAIQLGILLILGSAVVILVRMMRSGAF